MFFFNKRTFSTLCFLAFLQPGPVFAESFEEALDAALRYHPSVEAAQAGQRIKVDELYEQEAAYFPELSVGATGGRVFGDNSTSRGLSVTRGSGYSYLWEGNVALNQTIFDGFETQNRIESAKTRSRSAAESVSDIRETIALKLAQAYFNVMRTRQALDLINTHNAQIDDYRGRIMVMVDEGAADDAELKRAEDITILLDNILTDYESQYRIAVAQYQELTGKSPEGMMALPEWDRSFLPENYDAAQNKVQNHPALKSILLDAEASEYEVEAEKAAFYPDVNGELSYLKKDQRDVIGGEVVDTKAVVRLNWSFSTGGAQFARVRQRQGEVFEAQAQAREIERQLKLQTQQAWIEYETSREMLNNLHRRVEINEDLFETNKAQFEGAQIRLLQLMQSENQLFQTKLEKLNAGYRQQLSELAILSALGQMQTAMGLQLPTMAHVKESYLFGENFFEFLDE